MVATQPGTQDKTIMETDRDMNAQKSATTILISTELLGKLVLDFFFSVSVTLQVILKSGRHHKTLMDQVVEINGNLMDEICNQALQRASSTVPITTPPAHDVRTTLHGR